MNTKHTPGPWSIEKQRAPNGSNYYRIVEPDSQANDCIAQCGPWMASRDGYEASFNARLIAASPKLLAAAKAAAACYRTFRNVPKNQQEWTSTDDETLNALFAAIDMAEGG